MSCECRLLLLLSTVLALCFIQGGAQECGSALTCGDCVSLAGCAWCTDTNFTNIRCMDAAFNNSGCSVLENPSGKVGQSTLSTGGNPINLRNIGLSLRVGQPQTFPVSVTAVRNLPLDLYILMDLSSSMGTALNNVKVISGQISQGLSGVTNNSRLAFGTYNDKDLFPFTPNSLGTFAFIHRIDFTSNTTAFSEGVNGVIDVTRNIDNAENVLEALAQVVACEEVLQWRSREVSQVARLVLVLTDAGFHYAGEGQLGGILTPYEGDCLLTRSPGMEEIQFTQFDVVDYPSIGQVAALLQKQDVNVIFAVTATNVPAYTTLASVTNERAAVSEIDVNGQASEILDLIQNEYRALLRDIFFREISSDQFTVEIDPMCPNNAVERSDGLGCTNVQLEDTVDFMVTVTLNSCDGLDNGQQTTLTLDAGAFGTFTVTVTGVCNCGCEAIQDVASSRCSGNGNFTCGVCECNEGYCGPMCDLTFDGASSLDSCPRGGPAFFNEVCSGRGQCNCECFCTGDAFGDACQCDTSSVECIASGDTEVCSGRGMCCNKACTCQNSAMGFLFRGDFCECLPAEEICFYEGEACNGRGDCLCDRCDCRPEWEGDRCQIPRETRCASDIDLTCIRNCRASADPPPEICLDVDGCSVHRPTLFVDMADIDVNTDAAVEDHASMLLGSNFELIRGGGSNARCEGIDEECTEVYYILDNSTHNAIVVIRERECTSTVFVPAIAIWSIALIIIGALIVLGIVIIILIKIIFVILDHIEVKRWQKEAREADFSKNQNPLYQSPEMQYTNVTYGKAL